MNIVSLFSGCGGMDLGFEGDFEFDGRYYDPHPFQIVWANDNDKYACETHAANFSCSIHNSDIANIECDPIRLYPRSNIAVLIGGFPCQDFSVSGKRGGLNTKRGNLYRHFAKALYTIRPLVFVAENVPGLISITNGTALEQIISEFAGCGYDTSYQILNAADYGVPQLRRRLFFIGTMSGQPKLRFPIPTIPEDSWRTSGETLSDLVDRAEDQAIKHVWSKASRNRGQGNKPIVKNRPSPTIRAEHHGNIEYHWTNKRRLSVREVARLQSFPDTFRFPCSMSESYRQVGNAVPPVVAWHLAKEIVKWMKT